MATYYYDQQIRRYLLQITRVLSHFYVGFGDPESPSSVVRVPVKYGDPSRQAQTVQQSNSASLPPMAPQIAFTIADLKYDRENLQSPTHISTINVRTRQVIDRTIPEYSTNQGNAFTVERLMPAPYKMTIKVDIFTSNTNQKLQLWEQIATLFNPSLEIQATDNFIDWSTITRMELDDTVWTSRSIPAGTDDAIDVFTFTLQVPIWISAPALVKKLGVVERVIASVYDAAGDIDNAITGSDILLGTRQVITPYNYQILVMGTQDPTPPQYGRIQCLPYNEPHIFPNQNTEPPETIEGTQLVWNGITNMYGNIRNGISYIELEQPDGTYVRCYITSDPTDDRFLIISQIDGLPSNTLPPIDAVINPLLSGPPNYVFGTRYLLTEATAQAPAWTGVHGPLVANAGDIVESDGDDFYVIFDAATTTDFQYVTNLTTRMQYRWTGAEWVKSVDGIYDRATWRLVI